MTLAKLKTLIKTELQYAPVPAQGFWDWPRMIMRRVPSLDRSYYLYGLLDCAEQLGHFIVASTIINGMRREIEGLIWDSEVPYFRTKAVRTSVFF